jgi:hypothetical protein
MTSLANRTRRQFNRAAAFHAMSAQQAQLAALFFHAPAVALRFLHSNSTCAQSTIRLRSTMQFVSLQLCATTELCQPLARSLLGRFVLTFGCARLFGRGVSARGPGLATLSLEPGSNPQYI